MPRRRAALQIAIKHRGDGADEIAAVFRHADGPIRKIHKPVHFHFGEALAVDLELRERPSVLLGDLRDKGGGLYAAEDADSEGEEGRFYVWSAEELSSVLGPALGAEAAEWYGVTAEGNFEGRTILHLARRGALERPPQIEAARSLLAAARASRVRPGLDDKIITEWNAMMCSTLVEAAGATGRDDWSKAAVEIATFLLGHLRRPDGRVLRSFCRGHASVLGYAADYAWLVDCCTRLGELTGEPTWTMEAVTIARQLLELFSDEENGGLYTTGADAPRLVVRPRDVQDGVTPSAGSVAAVALARLGALTGDDGFSDAAARIIASARARLAAAPSAFAELLLGAELVAEGPVEIAVTGDRPDLVRAARTRFVPGAVLAWRAPARGQAPVGAFESPLLSNREDGFAYLCRRGACLAPVRDADALLEALDSVVASR